MKKLISIIIIFSLAGNLSGSFVFKSNTEFKIVETVKEQYKKYKFQVKSNKQTQILYYSLINKKKIKFKIEVITNNKKKEILGIADLIQTFDGETISDEDENAYFVDEYKNVNVDCSIIIRIDNEEHQVAQILRRDCKNNYGSFLLSKVMKRVK